jgi:hypothetical protein
MDKKPNIINIIGKVEGSEDDHLFQSVYPFDKLIKSLGIYLTRSLEDSIPIPVKHFQDVINKKACKVDELQRLSFEPNQRVGELIALVSLVAAINKINEIHKSGHTDFAPAWQKTGQNDQIEKFTGKGSWDGFVYKHVPLGAEELAMKVVMTGVEIKSLMIKPHGKFTSLNDLLTQRMPAQFSEHFQIDGSLAVVLVPPYSNELDNKITFDLKKATEDINNNVGKVVSALVFIDNKNDGEETTIATLTYLVHKNPNIVGGNIDHVEMVRVPFCKFKNNHE